MYLHRPKDRFGKIARFQNCQEIAAKSFHRKRVNGNRYVARRKVVEAERFATGCRREMRKKKRRDKSGGRSSA